MSEHFTDDQIESYVRQSLPAAELLPLSDHLAGCETCRRRLERALAGDLRFLALRSEVFDTEAGEISAGHPTLDSMAAHADGMLAGQELQEVTDHLTGCEQCSVAANDLRSFRQQLAPTLAHQYEPATVERPKRWWQDRFLFPPSRALSLQPAFVLLLLLGIGWLIWQRVERNEAKPDLVRTIPPPASAPATPPPLIAELKDGQGRVSLDQQGRLSGVDHLPPDYQRMVKETLLNQRLETSPLLAGLSRPASSLMSGSDPKSQFSVIEPAGIVSESIRPTFRWSPLEGTARYIVEVYDEAFDLVAKSPPLSSREWTPPRPLQRGRIYSWQVRATRGGQELITPRPPAPQAKLRILDSARAKELEQARRAYPSSHLILGLLSAKAGLLEEAEKEFRLLQEQNSDSALLRRLLDQVQRKTSPHS